jgi:hypothetical protein
MAGEIEDLENTLGYDPLPKRRVGRLKKQVRPKKLVCKHGHPFEGDNIIYKSSGARNCKTCQRASQRKWYAKNPNYNANQYAAKTEETKLRFRWDGEEGRVVGEDFRKLLETDWLIAADFLKDVIQLAQGYYDEVLKAKYTDKGADHGG